MEKAWRRKQYKYFTVTRRSIAFCESYEPMGDSEEFLSDLRRTLPIRDEITTRTDFMKHKALFTSLSALLVFATVSCMTVPDPESVPDGLSVAELNLKAQESIDESNYKAAEVYYNLILSDTEPIRRQPLPPN